MTTQQLTAPFSRLIQGFEAALQSWTMRRELDGMDDRMLKDLGISRAQAEFESRHGASGAKGRAWNAGPLF